MDASQLFLGRPWLHDYHVIYDGHNTTYSLKHNGKKLLLALWPPPEPHKDKPRKGSEKSPPERAKHRKSVPLVRASLESPY